MTENSLNVGALASAQSSSYAAAPAQAEGKASAPQEPVPVGKGQNGKKGKAQLLKEPKMPDIAGQKQYYPKSGESVISIAKDNHVYVSELLKANPGMDQDKIYENKAINVPYRTDKAWNKYQKDVEAYQEQQFQIEEAKDKAEAKKKLEARIDKAESGIAKANELGYGKSYTFKVDQETGNILITLKENKSLGDIKSDFRLPAKHLLNNNPSIKDNLKPSTYLDTDQRQVRVNDWDSAEAQKGNTFAVGPEVFKPSEGWFADWFNELF